MVRFLKLLILVPVAAALVIFGVANRAPVTLLLEPFSAPADALTLTLPLFVVLFAVLAIGIVIGSVITWVSQGRYRKAGREARREAERLAGENARLKTALPATATALLGPR
ncbi:MAG: LapA family protein [Proteobacteria bacterium]|nr:LapA family protein [Pseudomonadota bacterium]